MKYCMTKFIKYDFLTKFNLTPKTVILHIPFSWIKMGYLYAYPDFLHLPRFILIEHTILIKRKKWYLVRKPLLKKFGVLLNHASTSPHLHAPPPSSFQPPSSYIHLHPTYFSLYPALCNTLNVIRSKILHVIRQFSQIWAEKFKVVHFSWILAHNVSRLCWFLFQH